MSRRRTAARFRRLAAPYRVCWNAGEVLLGAVAQAAGFSSAIALRPHFRAAVGVAPQSYRLTFREPSVADSGS
jgi:hypothetical protein